MKRKKLFIKKQGISLINTFLLIIAISLLIIDITEIRDQNKLIKENNEILIKSTEEINKNISIIQETQIKNTESINLIKKEILSGLDKLCALEGLSVNKANYKEDELIITISNVNNHDINGFLFRFYNNEIKEIDSNETIKEFEIKEYRFKTEKPQSIGIIPKMLIDNKTMLCNKELKSDVGIYYNLTGTFNVTADMKAAGTEKDMTMLVDVTQQDNNVLGEVKVQNESGSYGDPFIVNGEIKEDKVTLTGMDITISQGSIEGIDKDLIADVVFKGIIKHDNLIEGTNKGDARIVIKDYPIQGLTITAEGTFIAEKL